MTKFGKVILTAVLLSGAAMPAYAQIDIGAMTDEIVVRGVNIPNEKRATSEISAVLDEAAFERTGDSNIADALRRVTGLSLAEGKFVIVRGLNERYSSATLNGSPLPSPEPLRRVAPLDLFPTSVLSGSLVQKTYSPEFSGEFGGGAIDLRTRSLPNESFFEVVGNVGLDTASTAKDGFTYDGGGSDWLGFDDGTRSVPDALQPFFNDGPQLQGQLTEAVQNEIDTSFNNNELLLLLESETPVNWGIRTTGGARFDISNSLSLGFVATAGLSTEFQTRDGDRRRNTAVNSDGTFDPSQGIELNVRSTQQDVDINGLLSVGAEILDNHEVTLTGLLLRSSTKEGRRESGVNNDRNLIQNDFVEFFERQVWQFQGSGEHILPSALDLTINWRVAYGEAFRDAPYERRVSYLVDEDTFDVRYDFTGQVNDISPVRFSRLDDENFGGGIDFKLPLTLADNAVDLKFGYAYTDKSRTTFDRRYFYLSSVNIPELQNSRIDLIYSDPVTGSNLLTLRQAGVGAGNPDNFAGNLEVHAGYAGIDAELSPYLRLAAGVRYETSIQNTQSSITGNAGSIINFAPIDEENFLPAATLTWNPTGSFQLRGGFSQTIVRPQFREIGPVQFTNPITDIQTNGNPELVNSSINNFDARFEWYFSRGEFFTIGAFYKEITNPIEELNSSGFGGGDQGASTFVNSPEAEIYGLEFEFQKNFEISEWFDGGWLGHFAETKELVFITNYTYTQSDVTGGQVPFTFFLANGTPQTTITSIEGDRALQGQSDHIANVQIGYRDFELGSQATLLFNYASRRIQQIGGGAPNNQVDELPPVLVDFVWNRELEIAGGDYKLEFAIRNIFGDDYDTQQVTDVDAVAFDQYALGRTFTIGFTRSF
ncbi:MAG: hypothetical protein EVA70_08900 [Parvularculaceae bacterium]|nr:MAG: hypothetical protein EVA70_08900 [Parvularculaceae bacterium]